MKRTFKKAMLILLSAVMVFGTVGIGVFGLAGVGIKANAATKYVDGYYTYTVEDNQAAIVDVDTSISGDVVVPSTLGGYPVTKVSGFYECKEITSIKLPETIVSISGTAFCLCSNLEKINIPESVVEIVGYWDDWNFIHGTKIANDKSKWENGSLYIDGCVVDSVDESETLNIKDGTRLIGGAAFTSCSNAKEIIIPNSVKVINRYAFVNCDDLEVTIPKTVERIDSKAFGYEVRVIAESAGICKIENFKINCYENSEGLRYAIENGFEYEIITENIDSGFVYTVDENLEVTINDFIAQIDGSLVIPDTIDGYPVTSIGELAFSYLDMDTIIFNCTHLETIGDGAFTGCANLTEVTIPDSVTSIGASGFSYNDNLTTVNIPESVEVIGESCFEYNTNLQHVNWDTATLTEIKESTFEGCAVLEEITIPSTVTHIGDYSFAYCENLIVNINDAINLIEIGDYAFTGCASLTEVTIPDTVTSIGASGFSYNDNLTTVNIPESVEVIGESCFEYNTNLQHVNWDTATLTEIEESTFEGCALLEEITIPPSVTHIDDYGFAYCSNLVSVCINDAIIEIGNYAFKDCVKIEGTQILYGEIGPGYSVPNDVKRYEMVLPYGLKKIGNSAFENCVSIKKLTIPDTVTTIGDSAFKSCTGIQSVNYTGTGMKWNTIDIQPNNSTLYADNITFMGKIIKTPSTTTVEYGETLYLHINADGLPNGAKIEWSTDSNAVSLKPATDGKSCGVTSVENGDAVITVKIADQNGNSVTDGNGDEISSTQKITSKAGLWQKIVSFFKNLFGISRIIEQRIKF